MSIAAFVLFSVVSANNECDQPRIRDTNALSAAIAQDKVMGQTFLKAAGACATPGEACTAARLECGAILTSTAQKQIGFDEGVWLRDMLLPYQGAHYPMTRTFGAAVPANDGSCNVEVAVLAAAAERRSQQAIRRDGMLQEYALYAKWVNGQLQQCKDKLGIVAVQAETARLEAERAAAATAAASAAVAAAAAAKAAEDKKARDAADAAAAQAKQAQLAEEQRLKDIADAEKAQQEQKDAAEKQRLLDEENKAVGDRDAKTAQLRGEKKKIVADAEAQLDKARMEEKLKRQAAVDAVSSSPAIASAAVAEAAEKNLVAAREKADAMEIDDSYERGVASLFLNGGFGAVDGGTGMGAGLLVGGHFGIYGTAPSSGMASGVEFRFWARYLGQITSPTQPDQTHTSIDLLLSGRYYFGHLALGLAGEMRFLQPAFSTLRFGVGPTLAAAFIDNKDARVVLAVNYLPIGNQMDAVRILGDFEVGYKLFSLHLLGGSMSRVLADGTTQIGWQLGAYIGLRYSW